MARADSEAHLPEVILRKATGRGNEYAWHPDDIPEVIETARQAGLVNLGGQLQFRLPGATCEIYYIEVEKSGDITDPDEAAARTLAEFRAIYSPEKCFQEGRATFPAIRDFEEAGGELDTVICFVWYLKLASY